MLSKVKTAYWYLGQPKGMFLTYDLILQKTIYQKNEKTGKQSQKWCESLAVTTSEAIQQLFGIAKDEIIRIEKEFSEEFRNANRLIAECPVKLGGAGNLDLVVGQQHLLLAVVALGIRERLALAGEHPFYPG